MARANKHAAITLQQPPEKARTWFGSESLTGLLVPIDAVKIDSQNARRHPERNQKGIRKSLATFGQQKPIVTDSQGIVRAGNGTLTQAKALGWTHIAAARSDLADQQLAAYALADNATSDFAEWDPDALTAQLSELDRGGFDLDAAGLAFSEQDLGDLLRTNSDKASSPRGDRADAGAGAGAGAGGNAPEDQWKLILSCRDEQHQIQIIDALTSAEPKALAAALKGIDYRTLVA
jgi:ParB-like chromosome segregation protein Spo0J